MKKQIVSLIMVLFFSWSNILWAETIHPQPAAPQAQSSAPSAPANPDALKLAVRPVISFTTDNVLVICAANCGSTAASNFYAYNNGAGFTNGTQAWNIEEAGNWFVFYQLPGAAWQRVTNSMLGKAPSPIGTGSATDNMYKNQPPKGHYRLWNKNGKNWQEFNLDNPNFSTLIVPSAIDPKTGRPESLLVVIKDLPSGKIIVHTENVKITHWGKTIRTLGIAAALTIGFGAAVYYAPGIILAYTPFP